MDWTKVGSFVFGLGGLLATGFLLYGGWLSITAWTSAPERVSSRASGLGIGAAAFVAILMLVLPQSAFAGESFDLGIDAYEDAKYTQAMSHFRVAADAGDAQAQEILGFMYLLGPTAYGAVVPVDREQAIYWFGRAATGGREIAKHVLCVLPGQPSNAGAVGAGCITGRRIAALRNQP